jgi:nucleoside-diphosphate-sugar epimerase
VVGLVRSEEKGLFLLQNEIEIAVGDLLHPESYLAAAKHAQVMIHCAADYADYGNVDKAAVATLIQASKETTGKKLFIYTSGILVYPDSPNRVVDEDDATQEAGWVVGERVKNERAVLDSTDCFGVVLRPAFVFGKKSAHFVHYFDQAAKGKVVVIGSRTVGWSHIHLDDLIDGYVRLAEGNPVLLAGHVFNFSDGSRYTNVQIAQRFAQVAGFKGEIEVDEKKGREFSNKTVFVDNQKAQRMLGWRPKHKLLLDDAATLYRAWMYKNPDCKKQETTENKKNS